MFTEHMFWKYDCAKTNIGEVEAITLPDEKIKAQNNLEGFLKITPASESAKYTPREHCEMQQVMRRPFEKHSQRSIV